MKVVLVAINAKYIHSNLAVYCLKSYSNEEFGEEIEIAEYTINQYTDSIIKDLYLKHPDVLAFSCYIWNRNYMERIITELSKVLPDTEMWAGGPEASYDAVNLLNRIDGLNGIIIGEGEITFHRLLHMWKYHDCERNEINGIAYRDSMGTIRMNAPADVMNLSDVVFPYKDMRDFENKIIYYESSRGCPFSCSYCLSSVEKKLRFRDMELVKKELSFFIAQKVKQVKFVDRTFNCRKERAMEIWQYLYKNDNGITNFHFEISADLLDEEAIELFRSFRPGMVQFEIGVQTTNPRTIAEINRKTDLKKLSEVVARIKSYQNIHQHLDLIAGLPYEDYATFHQSFNDVYDMMPDQLQLGFLKVLKGSAMYDRYQQYGMQYQSEPPYEILYTKWLSYADVLKLKEVEEMVEVYYNSGQFVYTMKYLIRFFKDAFEMYEKLGKYYEEYRLFDEKQSRMKRYEILYDYAEIRKDIPLDELRAVLVYDLYLRENLKSRPSFQPGQAVEEEKVRRLQHKYRRNGKTIHVEAFEYHPEKLAESTETKREITFIKFDYTKRNPLNHNAQAEIEKEEEG